MSENDAKKNKHRFKDIEKTSRESNEQQVLTVAAFCFAIRSEFKTFFLYSILGFHSLLKKLEN